MVKKMPAAKVPASKLRKLAASKKISKESKSNPEAVSGSVKD